MIGSTDRLDVERRHQQSGDRAQLDPPRRPACARASGRGAAPRTSPGRSARRRSRRSSRAAETLPASPTPIRPSDASTNVAAPTKRIELTGVWYCALSRVNHAGSRSSQPGDHRQPRAAGEVHARLREPDHDHGAERQRRRSPRRRRAGRSRSLSSCGIGAMRSISSIGIMASTELVPRMNITTMIGAAIARRPA